MNGAAVVVPLRGRGGKTRLGSLPGGERERDALVALLARHVLTVALQAPGVDRVLLVTSDPSFAAALAPTGVEVLAQAGGRPRRSAHGPGRHGEAGNPEAGLNAAVQQARACLPQHTPVIVLHGDLPALVPDDVAALLAVDAPVALAPDGAGQGTNALALARADLPFRARFGGHSLAAHLAEARRHGLNTAVVDTPGLREDLDDPEDWARLPAGLRADLRRRVTGHGTRIPTYRTSKGLT